MLLQLLGFVVWRYTWNKVQGFRQYRLKNLTVGLVHSSITGCWALSMLALSRHHVLPHDALVSVLRHPSPHDLHRLFLLRLDRYASPRNFSLNGGTRASPRRQHFRLHISCSRPEILPLRTLGLLMEINSIFLHHRSIMQLSGEYQMKPRNSCSRK
ncbi:hypothetical protein L596_002402 [Steinernema carpocapsae]|uniref:TLC domain-containing protein n=1 Tax=Steinernema carpocapsae TaxID=34508 RepID=A0A4V6I7P8_STECR|nr:hypothetical protein L596_002402 [Steinernema carpocapsae]